MITLNGAPLEEAVQQFPRTIARTNSAKGVAVLIAQGKERRERQCQAIAKVVTANPGITSGNLWETVNRDRSRRGERRIGYTRFWELVKEAKEMGLVTSQVVPGGRPGGTTRAWLSLYNKWALYGLQDALDGVFA